MRLSTFTSSSLSLRTLLPAVLLLSPTVLALPKSKPKATTVVSATITATAATTPEPTPEKPKGRPGDNKYFHEPGDDDYSGHYDSRYYHGLVSDEERTITLSHMMKAYLVWFREKGLETWIAHGTLLGWWWNGKMLPWDWDIDTQVSGNTLAYMARHFNRTVHDYVSEDRSIRRTYLLDVNPWSFEPGRGDGQNIIDARWIDTSNGLYIDITGLRELHPDTEPGVWEDKNSHKYHTKDLYPMRESLYHGVPAQIPYAYDSILTEEYQEKALVATEWEGHIWNPDLYEWTRVEPKEDNADLLVDEDDEDGKQYH